MCENNDDYTDTVDPRVHVELERLNNATDEINRLEVGLSEARVSFRHLLCESTQKMDELRSRLGICIDRAKPYYEARFCSNESLRRTQLAAMRFEKANSAHSAAREMVYLAEQGLGGRTLDPAWQEMLNHATQRVNDAEKERIVSESEHKFACIKHEATSARVKTLQKELKRAIAKSSLSIRRSFLQLSSIASRHELMLLPYYEMKAHFNHLLEQQRNRVTLLEHQVQTSKLTYADALRNLEQISDEIHRTRNSQNSNTVNITNKNPRQTSVESTESSYVDDFSSDEFKHLAPLTGCKLGENGLASPLANMEEVPGYRNVTFAPSADGDSNEVAVLKESHSNEWTEINLDVSSPEEEWNGGGNMVVNNGEIGAQRLVRQKTLPNPRIENEYASIKSKMKLETSISNWISRSSAKNEPDSLNSSRRQSLDNILGPTSEKMKEIFSHGMMMLNISSVNDRRSSEPRHQQLDDKNKLFKKLPSPLEKTLTYLNADEDNSDTESLSSVDMLNEEQINSLMLDNDLGDVCEKVLGSALVEIVQLPKEKTSSSQLDNK